MSPKQDPFRERKILKIIEWAHRQGRTVQSLTNPEIKEALRVNLRQPSHAHKNSQPLAL